MREVQSVIDDKGGALHHEHHVETKKKIGQQICYDLVSNSRGFILTRQKAFLQKEIYVPS